MIRSAWARQLSQKSSVCRRHESLFPYCCFSCWWAGWRGGRGRQLGGRRYSSSAIQEVSNESTLTSPDWPNIKPWSLYFLFFFVLVRCPRLVLLCKLLECRDSWDVSPKMHHTQLFTLTNAHPHIKQIPPWSRPIHRELTQTMVEVEQWGEEREVHRCLLFRCVLLWPVFCYHLSAVVSWPMTSYVLCCGVMYCWGVSSYDLCRVITFLLSSLGQWRLMSCVVPLWSTRVAMWHLM